MLGLIMFQSMRKRIRIQKQQQAMHRKLFQQRKNPIALLFLGYFKLLALHPYKVYQAIIRHGLVDTLSRAGSQKEASQIIQENAFSSWRREATATARRASYQIRGYMQVVMSYKQSLSRFNIKIVAVQIPAAQLAHPIAKKRSASSNSTRFGLDPKVHNLIMKQS